jgi:hypothetical protein
MDYKLKYLKYKRKYLLLKTKIIGGMSKYMIYDMNFKRKTIKIKKCKDKYKYNNFSIKINNNFNIILNYKCSELNIKVKIEFNDIKLNEKDDEVILFLDEINIKTITIYHNKSILFECSKFKNKKLIINNIFNLNETNDDKNFYDLCIDAMENKSYDDIEYKKIKTLSITFCNVIHDKIKNIDKQNGLFMFIHDVYIEMLLNNINDEKYIDYANKIFKSELPIEIPPKLIKIFHNGVDIPLDDDFKIIVDTGNESYTRISERVFNKITNLEDTSIIHGVCPKVYGEGGGSIECNKIIKFQLKIYGKVYTIVAGVLENTDNIESHVDILFGGKCGIDVFFTNMTIDNKNLKKDKIEISIKENYYEYLKGIDKLIVETHTELIGNKEIIDEKIIKSFVIKIIKNYFMYTLLISHHDELTDKDIGKYYDKVKKFKNIDNIIDLIKIEFNLTKPTNMIFYFDMSDTEYDIFVNNHFDALRKLKCIMDIAKKRNKDKLINSFIYFLNSLIV